VNKLHEIVLELWDDMRDLGICMDSNLKLHIHTDPVANKANCTLGLIYKVFECKGSGTQSVVHPLFEYNNTI